LIGGLGPGATVHYYQELAKARAGEILIVHADMDRVLSDVQRGDISRLAEYLARLTERLANGGADLGAISAITPHICIRELQKLSALPLVNIVDEVTREVHARGYQKLALFGTRFVVESRSSACWRESR
jgi:aspartate racemase